MSDKVPYRLEPMATARVTVVVKNETLDHWKEIEAKIADCFPAGFTQTGKPDSLKRTTFKGSWWNKESGGVDEDPSELFFVDYPPSEESVVAEKLAEFKEYLHVLLDEKEIWLIIDGNRLLTPSSPGWSDDRQLNLAI